MDTHYFQPNQEFWFRTIDLEQPITGQKIYAANLSVLLDAVAYHMDHPGFGNEFSLEIGVEEYIVFSIDYKTMCCLQFYHQDNGEANTAYEYSESMTITDFSLEQWEIMGDLIDRSLLHHDIFEIELILNNGPCLCLNLIKRKDKIMVLNWEREGF